MEHAGPTLDAIKPGFKTPVDENEAKLFCINGDTPFPKVMPTYQGEQKVMCLMDYILSEAECEYFRGIIDSSSHLSFWSSAGREDKSAYLFRDADTIEVEQSQLAGILWERVKHIFEGYSITIDADDQDNILWERELPGTWYPTSINQNFLFARYPPGGHFAPHTDGRVIQGIYMYM
jgi:hypothetical protein